MYENTKTNKIYKPDLLYPDLSYQIIGILFDVFLELGSGYKENQYQKAIEIGLNSSKLAYKKELPIKITYKNNFITTIYKDIEQVYNYLKTTNSKLKILDRFTRSGVKFKRIVNIR